MRNRVLIIGVIAVAVIGAWFLALSRPEARSLKAARASQASAQAKHQELAAELLGLRAIARDLPKQEAAMAAAASAVPTSPAIEGLIDQVANAARSDGVTWSSETQTLATSATGRGPANLSLSFVVSGTTANVARFVTALQHLPRLVVVSAVAYTSQGSGFSAQITAKAIYDTTPVPVAPAGGHAGT